MRKWAYSRVRPRVDSKYTLFGTRTHKYREDWLTYATPPDANTPEGRCALAGLELLPMPGTCLVEASTDFRYGGVKYVGKADVVEYQTEVHVHDHKTCGSFDYALTSETLLTDPQRILYSYWAASVFQAPSVRATWHYLRRTRPVCKPVTVVEDTPTIAARFAELHHRDGLPIYQAHASGAPPEAYPRNLDHCGAFGGCPYAEECLADVSPMTRAMSALRKGKRMITPQQQPNLMAHLQGNAQPPNIPPPPAAPAQAPVPPMPAQPQPAAPPMPQQVAAPAAPPMPAQAVPSMPQQPAAPAAPPMPQQVVQAATIRAQYGLPQPAPAPATTVDPATKTRKVRSDKGKARTGKAATSPIDALLLAAIEAGLPVEQARGYLALRDEVVGGG